MWIHSTYTVPGPWLCNERGFQLISASPNLFTKIKHSDKRDFTEDLGFHAL